MRRPARGVWTLWLPAVVLAAGAGLPGGSPASSAQAKGEKPLHEAGSYGELPLPFIENRGQADPRARYYHQGAEVSVFFTVGGLRLSLIDRGGTSQRWGLGLDFVGAGGTLPVGRERTETLVSYFKGEPDEWRTGLPTYEGLRYGGLWRGIDLRFSADGGRLKYEFVIHPGADPSQVRLAWRGASSLELTPGGGLLVRTPAGTLTDQPPVSFQEVGGRRVEVPTAYTLDGETVGFRLAAYDHTLPLVIDPALLYAGFIGGMALDQGAGIAVDATGATYVTGTSNSTQATFPASVGPDLAHNSGFDAFVAKVNPQGTALLYAGYIGGSGSDHGFGIAVDAAGAAYVAGRTDSGQATFPVAVGPDLAHNGGFDAFVAKVNPQGMALLYAGYIGGSGLDHGVGIAVDAAGAAYVAGRTESEQATFPVAVGPDLTHNGGDDAFVAKMNPAGVLLFAGYIGGAELDRGVGIAVDAGGAAYVAGRTDSGQATFPVAVGPDLSHNGGTDAFVARVNPQGMALDYSGYIGGSGFDRGSGIAVDAAAAAYVAGETDSSESTFPVAVGPDLTHNGGTDAFVAKVNPQGMALIYAGYVGGSAADFAADVSVDAGGAAYVDGGTTSTEAALFPVAVGPDLSHNGGDEAFVAKVETTETCKGRPVTQLYGPGDDVIVGTPGDDVVLAGGGDDTIQTLGGGDLVCAGDGDDTVRTGGGKDRLIGERGDDLLSGQGGNDTLKGSEGKDHLKGGGGKDLLAGSDGNDRLKGQGSDDTLRGGSRDDVLSGGPGKHDLCKGGGGTDVLKSCENP